MTAPSPYLTYHMWAHLADDAVDPTNIVGEGSPLFDVHEVSASVGNGPRRGLLLVHVRGPMRTKAGGRGPGRGVDVDLDAVQPAWLADIITDARRRLDLA